MTDAATPDGVSTSVHRVFAYAPAVVFDAWLDAGIRRAVLLRSTYKNCIKEIDPREGGIERYEHRWKNRLLDITTRRNLSVERPNEIVAHRELQPPDKAGPKLPNYVLVEEKLRFGPRNGETELIVTERLLTIKPRWLGPLSHKDTSDWWNLDLDVFEQLLTLRES